MFGTTQGRIERAAAPDALDERERRRTEPAMQKLMATIVPRLTEDGLLANGALAVAWNAVEDKYAPAPVAMIPRSHDELSAELGDGVTGLLAEAAMREVVALAKMTPAGLEQAGRDNHADCK